MVEIGIGMTRESVPGTFTAGHALVLRRHQSPLVLAIHLHLTEFSEQFESLACRFVNTPKGPTRRVELA